MNGLVGHIINALAGVGVACVAYFIITLLKRRYGEVAAESSADENLRNHIDEQAKRQQTAIERAVNGDSAPGDLAALGNRRRE